MPEQYDGARRPGADAAPAGRGAKAPRPAGGTGRPSPGPGPARKARWQNTATRPGQRRGASCPSVHAHSPGMGAISARRIESPRGGQERRHTRWSRDCSGEEAPRRPPAGQRAGIGPYKRESDVVHTAPAPELLPTPPGSNWTLESVMHGTNGNRRRAAKTPLLPFCGSVRVLRGRKNGDLSLQER